MRQDRIAITGEGRIGNDPTEMVLRYGERKGEKMTSARVACHMPKTGSGTGQGTHTEWIRLLAGGGAAEALMMLSQGDRVAFEGLLRRNVWTGRNGVERSGFECLVERLSTDQQTVEA